MNLERMTTEGDKETQYIEAVFICQVYIPIYFKSMKEEHQVIDKRIKQKKPQGTRTSMFDSLTCLFMHT